VSVIVPVFETAPFVSEALDSVLAQTYTDYEIIVVNDGSPDSELLLQILESYRGRIRYIVQENRGSSGARNTALRAARGYYVALLDSDDRWHQEFLSSQIRILENDPTIDVVYSDALRFDSQGVGTKRYSETYPVGGDVSFLRVLSRECQIYGEVVARRETILRVGMYDETFQSGEDLDLWLRVLKAGGRITYNDQVLAYYRVREGSHTSNPLRMIQNVLKLLEKVGRDLTLSQAERAALEFQRSAALAELSLLEGKLAIAAGDRRTAITKLRESAKLTSSWKLRLAVAALSVAPSLVIWLYRIRERWDRRGIAVPGSVRSRP
jgi:glycosyltransferase involved in cell wall biosynthesis